MGKLTWEMTDKSEYVSKGIDIFFSHPIDPLKYFLASISPYRWPEFLRQVMEPAGYFANEITSFVDYDAMDWEDLSVSECKKGEVEIFNEVFGNVCIEKSVFIRIAFDYGSYLLDRYKQNKLPIGYLVREQPREWYEQMELQLERLKGKMEEHIPESQ